MVDNLGFRSAPPQALRYRHAPRAKAIQLMMNFISASFSLSWSTQEDCSVKVLCLPTTQRN
jgi:hypothetical protein